MVIFEDLEQERLDAMISAVLKKHWGKISSSNLEEEDLRQEMLLKVFRVLPQYDPAAGASVYVYCQTACENRLFDILRKEANNPFRSVMSLDGLFSSTEDGTGNRVDIADKRDVSRFESAVALASSVRQARASLGEDERAIFDMLVSGMTQKEIARQFGCTQPNISAKVAALRKSLAWLRDDLV